VSRAVEQITLSTGTPAITGRPEGEVSRGLVLWPDIGGLRKVFEDHVARLASERSWVVCAIEPFPGREGMTLEERFAAMPGLSDADKLADLEAAIDVCSTAGATDVGVIGFCMGGMLAMKSLASPRIDRAAAFYGMVRVPESWRGPQLTDAIDTVAQRPGDLLGVFGMKDPWCPVEQIEELAALGAHVARYPEADHGWAHDSTREGYRPDDAADAWTRAERFLATGDA
jgi:carboxymethylenebutenolidase